MRNKKKIWLAVVLVTVLSVLGNQMAKAQHLVLNTYSNQNEIKSTGSITLTDGFYIPAGKTVRIFTGASFQQCVPFAGIPSTDHNYVSTRVFKMSKVNTANLDSARKTCEVNQTIQYIDGLGRLLQTVTVQGSPGFRDLVQPVAYDPYGRESRKYLPYVSSSSASNGSFKPNAIVNQDDFYTNPALKGASGVKAIPGMAFSETRFETSPLNRILEEGAPGESWQLDSGHTLKLEYGFNTDEEVTLWTATSNGVVGNAIYSPGRLHKTTSKDENWETADGKAGITEEFKDFDDRIVLRRIWETNVKSLSTYYVYDELGNLRYVMPPAVNENGQSTIVSNFTEADEVFKQFIYGYHYDERNRLIEKKIPGKGWEYLVYNSLDQVVFIQDARQHQAGQWVFNKYDALGRLVVTGMYADGASRLSLQTSVNNQVTLSQPLWETRDNANSNALGTGYSNVTIPTADIVAYHSINYYDDYSFYGNSFGAPVAPQAGGIRTKSLLTGIRTNILGMSTRLLTVNYYDEEGRVIQNKSENHLGGTDIVNNTYSFVGELTASTRTHTGGSGPATSIATRYEYDHMGRKLATMESINGQTEVVLSKLAYNEIGQLLKKDLHSTDNGNSFLQHTNYAYNERGWLKRSISDQFSVKLGYDTLSNPQYNGNITSQEWGASNTFPSIYNYGYDKLNRLLSGASTGAISMSEQLSYDAMGNIASLNRDGVGAGTYFYEGNRLTHISGGGLALGTYAYDVNGNATTDGRTGVTLSYNYLNLPATVTRADLTMAYTYDAAGNKLKKESNMEPGSDYVNGIQYSGGAIEFVMTEEGKARNNGGVYSYEYNLTDHLGNVRYTFNQHPSLGTLQPLQSDDYYAFGKQRVVSAGTNKYLYNGKELQNELGQLDYGARFYDPVISRFTTIDNSSEDYQDYSPYIYVGNNPVKRIDPDGNDWGDVVKGAVVAIIDNATGGAVNLRGKVSYNSPNDFNRGQDVGDVASIAIGGVEGVAGANIVAGGIGVTVLSGGTASIAAVPAAAGGAAMVGHGVAMMSSGASNLSSQKGRVSEEPKRTKHTDNRHIDRSKYPDKSKYSKPNQVEKLENRTMKNPDKTKTQSNGRVVYEKDFGRKIGTKGETSQKVVLDPKKNKVITSYPQK